MTDTLIDKRDLSYDRLATTGGAGRMFRAMRLVAADVGHTVSAADENMNAFTGHASELRAQGAQPEFAATSTPTDGEFVKAAKDYMRSVSAAVGFEAGEPIEFEGDPKVTSTSQQMRVVSLQQTLNGIEVWGMEPKVWFRADGAVDRVSGDTVSLDPSLPTEPKVTPEIALQVAAQEAAKQRTKTDVFGERFDLPELDLSRWAPVRTGYANRAARPTSFENGPFEDIATATLVYFYMGGETRLAWRFVLAREFHAAQFLVFVDAVGPGTDPGKPEILYCKDLTSNAIAARVYKHSPDEGNFERVVFPLPADAYPLPLPSAGLPPNFPLPWTELRNGQVSTIGNNVQALSGQTRLPVTASANGSGGEFVLDAGTPEQYVTNIFYFCNYMHDFFLMLGFSEEHGNFQSINVTGRGIGADPVHAFAHPRAVYGTANMATRADGVHAIMNMGLVTRTNRHTANDADVVFHEFVHGVTNRLVGGLRDAEGLVEEQSVAMGEGWSDFFALTISNFSRSSERATVGTYVVNDPKGIRQRPYDENYPGSFGDIGKSAGEINGLSYTEVHDVGEIWCAALLQVVRNLTHALGDKTRAYQLTWQAVVDGLKLTPKNPTFLVARNAMLHAFSTMQGRQLNATEYKTVQRAAWEAFAKFGMGVDATCPNPSFNGCHGGTQLPPDGWED